MPATFLDDEPVGGVTFLDDEPAPVAAPPTEPKGTLARAYELGSSPYSESMAPINPAVAEMVTGNEPILHLPRVEQQPEAPEGASLLEQGQAKGRQINAAVVNAGAGLVEGLTSPTNLQLLPAAAAPGLGRIVSAIFGAEMLRHVPEQVQAAEEAPTFQRKLEGGLGVVGTMLFAGAAGKHAAGKAAPDSLRATVEQLYPEKPEAPLAPPKESIAPETQGGDAPLSQQRQTQQEPSKGVSDPAAMSDPEAAGVLAPLPDTPAIASEPAAARTATEGAVPAESAGLSETPLAPGEGTGPAVEPRPSGVQPDGIAPEAPRPVEQAAPEVAGGSLRIIPENKAAQWVVDNAKRLFTAEGDLPVSTFQRWSQRHGEVKEQSRQTAYATRDLQAALKDEFKIGKGEELTKGFSKVPPEFVSQMNDALLGQADINTLPESVREPLHRMREHIDTLSESILREGVIPDELRAKVEGNLGVYMTRSYRVFDDIKWPDKVAPEVRNRAADFVLKDLQRSNPAATPETARAVVESMLTDWKQQGSGALLKTGGKLGSKDLTSLIARKDIPEVIRQLMGEYKDPVINYTRSVAKMSNLLGNARFLNEARAQGMGKWLFEDGSQPVSHSALIAAEASDVMAPLNGLRTTPEIAEAFRTFGKSEPINSFWAKTYFRINGLAKAGKTIGSVMTQVRNTVGQGYFWLMNGHFDIRPTGGALKSIAADIGLTNDVKWRESYKRYLRLNVVDQSAKAGELRDVIKDAALNDVNVPGLDAGGRTMGSLKKLAIDAPIRAYQLADDLGKIVGFENELARQKAINPGVDVASLEKIAAERIQNTYPTYTRVPEWVKQFRRQPVVGPFMTFAYESFRTAFHNLRYTIEDLGSSNPAQKKAGVQRLTGQLAVLGGGYVVGSMSRSLLGLSMQDEDDLRRFLPRWDKNAQLMFTGVADGKADYVNLSFANPYSYLTDPVMAVANGLRGDDELSTLIARSFGEIVRPFASEDILANSLIDVARNTTETGGRVYNPQDTPENVLAAKLKHVAEAIEPGTSTRLRKKIVPALQGKQTPFGGALNPAKEIGSELTGFKQQTLDYEQAVAFKARSFRRNDTEAEGLFREVMLRRGTVTLEEMTEAFTRSNSQRFELWKSLYGDTKAALRRGVSSTAIKESLIGNGIGKADAAKIMDGKYVPYEPGDDALAKVKRLNRSIPAGVTGEIARSKTLLLSGEYQ